MHRPRSTEYAPNFDKYVALVPEENILSALETQLDEMITLLRVVPEAEANVRHSPYTWSVKEVVGHLTDSERIFGYRALRFARGDSTPLPGFDENVYVQAAKFDHLRLTNLLGEFETVRRSHVYFFRSLNKAAWSRVGEANGNAMSVRALAYTIVGHARHHTVILRKRLVKAIGDQEGKRTEP